MRGDVLSLEHDSQPAKHWSHCRCVAGSAWHPRRLLAQTREHATRELAALPEPLRKLEAGMEYPVDNFRKLLRDSPPKWTRKRVAEPELITAGLVPTVTNIATASRPVPAAGAFAVHLVTGIGDDHRVLELDEAARRMHERRLDRHHHAGLERLRRRIRPGKAPGPARSGAAPHG